MKNQTKVFLLSGIVFIFSVSCSKYGATASGLQDRDLTAELPKILTASYWKAKGLPKNLSERVRTPGNDLIDRIKYLNERDKRPKVPFVGREVKKHLSEMRQFLIEMPEPILASIRKNIFEISVVSNLGSSAISDYVYEKDGTVSGGFLVFDEKIFDTDSNIWMSERESSPFHCGKKIQIEMKISNEPGPKVVVQYFLLHELAHIFSEGSAVNPFSQDPPDQNELNSREFGPISWVVANGAYISRYAGLIGQKKIPYYAADTEKLPCDVSLQLYEKLKKTDFPSLYAIQDPFEDFAESFANYVHSEILKRPFLGRIFEDAGKTASFSSCWKEPRCKKKGDYLSRLYKSLPL